MNLPDLLTSNFFKSIFTKEYHAEITELFTSVNKFVYSADPTLLIDLGATRQSGSAETSISNTVLNAAVVLLGRLYQGHREFVDTLEYSDNDLLVLLNASCYAGDDGIVCDMIEAHLRHAASALGMKMTTELRRKGEPADFLARFYPTPDKYSSSSTILAREAMKMAYGEINTHAKNEILRDKVNSRCVNESGNNHYGDKFVKIYISLLEKYNTDLQIIKPGLS